MLNRLTGLLDANDDVRGLPTSVTELRQAGLGIRNLDVKLPDGRPLLTDLDIEMGRRGVVAGQGLLGQRQDPRCCGAWQGCGRTSRAPSRAPRTAIPCSPRNSRNCRLPCSGGESGDDAARDILRAVQLEHLVDRLDEDSEWAKTLAR